MSPAKRAKSGPDMPRVVPPLSVYLLGRVDRVSLCSMQGGRGKD